MKYSFNCPACSKKMAVEAGDGDEAVNSLMVAGAAHGADAHPDMDTPEDKMREIVKVGMQKEN